jgi:hypothetical protein
MRADGLIQSDRNPLEGQNARIGDMDDARRGWRHRNAIIDGFL